MLHRLTILALALFLCSSLPCVAAEADSVDHDNKTLLWPDGTRYVGGVKDGKREGKGTIFWKDGTRFVGTFKDDLRNGPGTMILPDGTVYNGFFRNDKLVEAPAEPGEPNTAEVAAAAAELEKASTGPTPAEALGTAAVTEITDTIKSEITSMVDLWAAAWAEQSVVQYLDYYSQDFDPPGRQSRSQWESVRRSRLTRPGDITIDIDYETFEIVENDVAEVSFKQTYRSDVYSDVTDKVLKLRKEGPYWKILEERSE